MSNIAIIPARGGSKRIPRKNIKDFLGKPIIAYSIETALESGLFDEVMVSTDDEEIAEISQKYGAKVPFMRSEENSHDHAGTTGVLLEVLNNYNSLERNFEFGCCIYPTAPLVSVNFLQKGFYLLMNSNYDSTFPIVKFSYPIQRALRICEDNKIEMVWPQNRKKRTQDFEKSYHDAGQFYWFNVNNLKKKQSLFTNNMTGIEVSELAVQDIDNESDWKIAEIKYQLLIKEIKNLT